LAFIKSHLSLLLQAIIQLEGSGLALTDSMALLEDVKVTSIASQAPHLKYQGQVGAGLKEDWQPSHCSRCGKDSIC